jgi:MoaA/NifB/PqqE/SkfB family radical SAM enzyme
MDNRKYGCNLPFHHMSMRPDGQIFPCCYFRWEEVPEDLNSSHRDPFQHPFLVELRKKMRRDEYIEGCSKCYADEAASGRSMRLDMNNPETIFGLPEYNEGRGVIPKLTNIDLALSNVCNNKCRMCGPMLSTQWYADAKKMGYEFDQKGVVARNSIVEDYDLSDLRFIKLLGGEPLMEQEKFIKVLKKCNLSKLTILLVSNATLQPNKELTELLKKCKKVSITLSVDSYGKINDFLRKGSNWETVEENIKWYNNTFNGYPVIISLHSVASLYNVNLIHELIDYCIERNMYHNYVVVDGPNWMGPRNLPEEIKPKILKYLETSINRYNEQHKKIFKLLKHEVSQPGDFGMFIRNDIRLNKIRSESWEHLNPWLWNEIQPYIVSEIL